MKSFTILLNLLLSITAAYPQQLSVKITSPTSGSEVVGTLTVTGTSIGATSVGLAVDDGPFQTANGVGNWNVVLEPGGIPTGTHALIARAKDASGATVFDTISVTVNDLSAGGQNITYASSVDGEIMGAVLWTPPNLDLQGDPVPLLVYLHGGGGTGIGYTRVANGAITRELDARGWIGIGPDGREWGQYDQGCGWRTSAAYVDNPDPNIGPGEQDILDVITWAKANFPIDEDRIYLSGFSMGGRGTYIIGLKNPDIFAAIAPMGPASDMFEIFVRRPNPPECKEGMVGGKPGDSDFVNTMYKITSARFLIENAFNLPVFHGHGLNDGVANNIASSGIYLHGFHMLMDNSWDACHGASNLCFGHTPTLSELQARHPDGYDWAYMFSLIKHRVDSQWIEGTPVGGDAQGVEDPQNPGNLIGLFEFLSRHTRVRSPNTVVYKSYTETHRKAYWAEIDITTPWQNIPGAIRASRNTADNALQVELVRVDSVAFDLEMAGLEVNDARPLTITIDVLNEPAFDPALGAGDETPSPAVVLRGDFSNITEISVLADGTPMDESLFTLSDHEIVFGPVVIAQPTTFVVQASKVTSVGSDDSGGVPGKFALHQNYPNPFNPETNVKFVLPREEYVTLKVFDLLGQEVKTLVSGRLPAGSHAVRWNAQDALGQPAASGVYVYRLNAGNRFVETKKMLLLR